MGCCGGLGGAGVVVEVREGIGALEGGAPLSWSPSSRFLFKSFSFFSSSSFCFCCCSRMCSWTRF